MHECESAEANESTRDCWLCKHLFLTSEWSQTTSKLEEDSLRSSGSPSVRPIRIWIAAVAHNTSRWYGWPRRTWNNERASPLRHNPSWKFDKCESARWKASPTQTGGEPIIQRHRLDEQMKSFALLNLPLSCASFHHKSSRNGIWLIS